MTQTRTCRGCGTQLDKDAPFGHCPRCLIEHGFLASDQENIESPTPDNNGRIFGDYELLEELGRGGMGVVFKARQISLSRTVALKMLRDSQLDSPLVVRRFQVEAETVAKLEHPNIVPIYEVGEHNSQHFFSMRLVEGEGLDEGIAHGAFRLSDTQNLSKGAIRQVQTEIAALMATVARAVHYAHLHGVLHRDLKPSNILLDANGQPHLTDFGVSKRLDNRRTITEQGAMVGTPSYVAPEQAAGEKITTAADVYSLGAILYELLTGQPPFHAPTPMETLRLAREKEPRRPTTFNTAIHSDLETICLKCLEKDPQQRYSSAEALAEDLERWQRHEPISARPAGPILRTTRWVRRNPVGASLILSLFAGLVASLVLLNLVLHQKNAAEQARLAADRAREIIWQQIGVSDFWEKPDATATISSEILDLITGTSRPAGGKIERYTVGMLLEEYPVDVIVGYAHLLRHVENSLGKSVRFDLKVYQENRTAIDALVRREVDLLKIGGQSYIRANKVDPNIKPLVSQNPTKTGVIFARADSDLKTLSDLKGKSIAANDTNSTIRLWATYHLVQAGISATNLKVLEQPPSVPVFKASRLRQAPKLAKGEKISDRAPVIEAVLTNAYDAGVVSEKAFKRAQKAHGGLIALKTFSSSPVFWLAGGKVPAEIANSIKDSMVNLHDPAIFSGLSDNVKSYSPVTPEQIAVLSQAAGIVAEQFGVNEDAE